MRLIDTGDLEHWGNSLAAQSRLPYFVGKLIRAAVEPESLRMPSGDAVWVPGADGEVLNTKDSGFVPRGPSIWEVGTDKQIKKKADGDYKKRSKVDRKEATFVFVTPRVWTKKKEWVAKRNAEGAWKDVRVIDGVDLKDWLERSPAVSLQLAAEMGLVPEEGLETPEQAWQKWSYLSSPPASEEIAVVGREEQEKELLRRLADPPNAMTIQGDSSREAWGFALAVLRRISSAEERFNIEARTIVTDSAEVAERLQNRRNLIIVLKQATAQVSGFLTPRGCHVVVPVGTASYPEQSVIQLARSTHRPFVECLVMMGLSEEEADRASRACGRSVTIMQRQRAAANFEKPRWAEGSSPTTLLPALLVYCLNNIFAVVGSS